MIPMTALTISDIKAFCNKPLLASMKIDGIRALSVNKVPMSRSGKKHRNILVQKMFEELPDVTLDGELTNCVDFADFGDNTKNIMSINQPVENLKYWIFDIVCEGNATERYTKLKTLELPEWCVVVEKHLINTYDECYSLYESYMNKGLEGIMLQNPNANYKHGRGGKTHYELAKYKEFLDSEAIIKSIIPYTINNNVSFKDELGFSKKSSCQDNIQVVEGLLGAIECETLYDTPQFKKGETFKIGTGFSMEQRKELWSKLKPNDIITFKYFPIGVKDKPRLPVFLHLRLD